MKQKKGFTLVELMVVIVIMGILVTIGTFAFQTSQKKARDSKRKSDLDQVTKALEMYNADAGVYPAGGAANTADAGKIVGCGNTTKTICNWGEGFANVTKAATYMVKLPKDPQEKRTYYYEQIGNAYRIYARLENTEDSAIPATGSKEYGQNCSTSLVSPVYCNFVITSSNIVAPTPKP